MCNIYRLTIVLILFGNTKNFAQVTRVSSSPTINPFGVIINTTQGYNFGPHGAMELSKMLGAKYIRKSIFLKAWPSSGGFDTFHDSILARGFLPITNLNWDSPATATVPFLTYTAIPNYTATINSVLNKYQPELVVIENEETNTNYYSGPIQYYLNMLTAAIPVVHAKGLKVTNGGLLFLPVNILFWKSLLNDSSDAVGADAYAKKTLPANIYASLPNYSLSSAALDAAVKRVDTVLNAYKTLNIDYLNLHWYADTRQNLGLNFDTSIDSLNYDTKVFKQTVNYLHALTGKTVITNEIGSNFMAPNYITALMTAALQMGMPYFIYYSGDGPGKYDAKALQQAGPSFVLRSIGTRYRCIIDSVYNGGSSCKNTNGIGEREYEKQFIQLYPNPATNKLSINTNGITINRFELTDISGRIISSGFFNKDIDVNQFTNGIYFLSLFESNGESYTQKFIKN